MRKVKVEFLLHHDCKVSIKNGRNYYFRNDRISRSGMSLLQNGEKLYMSGGYKIEPSVEIKPISLLLSINQVGRVTVLNPMRFK